MKSKAKLDSILKVGNAESSTNNKNSFNKDTNTRTNIETSLPQGKTQPLNLSGEEREKLFNLLLQHCLFKDKSASILNTILDKLEMLTVEENTRIINILVVNTEVKIIDQ